VIRIDIINKKVLIKNRLCPLGSLFHLPTDEEMEKRKLAKPTRGVLIKGHI